MLKNGYVFKSWNTEPPDNFTGTTHKGIAVSCNRGEKNYAAADGIIQNKGTSPLKTAVLTQKPPVKENENAKNLSLSRRLRCPLFSFQCQV
jgi:uncharacterized protein YfaS (alpha-2-macroglobulin family)